MRFLVDASLPRSAPVLLKQMGHDAVDVRDIEMRSATDEIIATHAQHTGADHAISPTSELIRRPTGIVVLQLPDHATAAQVVKLLEAFVRREDWLACLNRRLAIVETWRVRFRPA